MAGVDSIVAERWRPVAGHDGYRVSDVGRVQSRRHRNGLPATDWRDLKPAYDGRGYPQVRLYRTGDRPHWVHVHLLVLAAFRGPCPAGMVARHVISNDPADCRLANLRWGTQSQNMADKWRHGTAQTADKRRSYLTRAEAAALGRRHRAGETIRELAAQAGRSYNAVQQAVRRARNAARYDLFGAA